ncbi:MAG: hypothetical protein GYA56_00350 [Geobacteraceae bacterium]|nr:hypothetical protein [Geobacteraceae bacterium]
MDLDHKALKAACFDVARKTLEDARPTDVERIRRLADTFYHCALEHMGRIRNQQREPDILVRAVAYLARTHAISQMHDSTEWFFFMLRALVEIACPEKDLEDVSIEFLADLESGIRQARQKIRHPDPP